VLLGEFTPALKATVWPYYAVSPLFEERLTHEEGLNQQEKDNLAHWKRSMIASQKAMIFLEGIAKKGEAQPVESAKVIELLKEALAESKLVRDDSLAKVHKELPRMHREKHVGGLEQLVHVLEEARDTEKLDKQGLVIAETLLDEWDEWINAHKGELRFPKDIPD